MGNGALLKLLQPPFSVWLSHFPVRLGRSKPGGTTGRVFSTGHSQHRFMRGRSCVINLVSFYSKVTHLVDQENPIDVIFLDFSQVFDTIFHSILLDKPSGIQLVVTSGI